MPDTGAGEPTLREKLTFIYEEALQQVEWDGPSIAAVEQLWNEVNGVISTISNYRTALARLLQECSTELAGASLNPSYRGSPSPDVIRRSNNFLHYASHVNEQLYDLSKAVEAFVDSPALRQAPPPPPAAEKEEAA